MLADFDAAGSLVEHLSSWWGITDRASVVGWVMLVEQTPVGQGFRSRADGVLENQPL